MIVSSSCTVHPKPTSGAEEDSMSTRIAAELNELPPTISVERAARLLGLSRSAAYRAAATGQLPTLAFGRRLVVPTFRLMQMLGIPEEASR
jgi:excisionase family DNA binding protein